VRCPGRFPKSGSEFSCGGSPRAEFGASEAGIKVWHYECLADLDLIALLILFLIGGNLPISILPIRRPARVPQDPLLRLRHSPDRDICLRMIEGNRLLDHCSAPEALDHRVQPGNHRRICTVRSGSADLNLGRGGVGRESCASKRPNSVCAEGGPPQMSMCSVE
jgi:hypothetical protein